MKVWGGGAQFYILAAGAKLASYSSDKYSGSFTKEYGNIVLPSYRHTKYLITTSSCKFLF
jgi:hypothetical protein